MTFTDIEEYNIKSIANLACNIYSKITVAHVTLPKAVLNTVKIFAVYCAARRTLLNGIDCIHVLSFKVDIEEISHRSVM